MKPDCLIVSIKIGKCFDDMQNIKKLKFEGDRVDLEQTIWNKLEESSKTRQVKKCFISTLACFWTATAKV